MDQALSFTHRSGFNGWQSRVDNSASPPGHDANGDVHGKSCAPRPAVTVVVLAYGAEPWVERCVSSILASEAVDVDVVLVDNGCTTGATARLLGAPGVTVLQPGRNLGFAGGCNAGAAAAAGDVLAFVNADAVVLPTAIARLAAVALRADVGLASGSIRLAMQPALINSVGNPLHFSGISWAGGLGEPAAWHTAEAEVASASGAGLAVRRELWQELGGFAPEYFAYHEDTELSLRCWQRGLRVLFVPDAVVEHRYEFSRNARKHYLVERNRLLLLLTLFEVRTLVLLMPALILVELCMAALALANGWSGAKVRGWMWILRHWRWWLRRRRFLQSQREVDDAALLPLLTDRLRIADERAPAGLTQLDAVLRAYWGAVRPLLARAAR